MKRRDVLLLLTCVGSLATIFHMRKSRKEKKFVEMARQQNNIPIPERQVLAKKKYLDIVELSAAEFLSPCTERYGNFYCLKACRRVNKDNFSSNSDGITLKSTLFSVDLFNYDSFKDVRDHLETIRLAISDCWNSNIQLDGPHIIETQNGSDVVGTVSYNTLSSWGAETPCKATVIVQMLSNGMALRTIITENTAKFTQNSPYILKEVYDVFGLGAM